MWHLQKNNNNIIFIYKYIYRYLKINNKLVREMSCDGQYFVGTGADAFGSGTEDLWEEGGF